MLNGFGFDTWIKLKNLPCDKHFIEIIKIGKGILSSRVFNGYIQKNQIPLFLIFICDMTHFNF